LELFFEDPQADRRTWHSFDKIESGALLDGHASGDQRRSPNPTLRLSS
jgi:hypothetical protein